MGVSAATASAIAAGVSAATAVGGTLISSQAQSNAAKAQSAQNAANLASQSQAFQSRMQAANAQTAAQTAAMQQSFADQSAAATQSRQAQMSALKGYQDTLGAENTQADKLRATGDAAAQQLLQDTSRPVLDQAQTQQAEQAAALLAARTPVAGPEASDPGGTNAVAGDATNRSAAARRTAEAATNIREYGGKIGQLASYSAPGEAINLAIAGNKAGIMPATTADALLRSGNTARLLPSQVAYAAATGEGNTNLGLIQSRGQNALDAAGLSYGNATQVANLGQADADQLAANRAGAAKQDAAQLASLGGLVSGVGNLGLYGSAYYGGLGKSLLPKGTA